MVVGKNNLPNGGGSVVMIYHIRIRKEMTKKKLAQIHKRKKSQKLRVEKKQKHNHGYVFVGGPIGRPGDNFSRNSSLKFLCQETAGRCWAFSSASHVVCDLVVPGVLFEWNFLNMGFLWVAFWWCRLLSETWFFLFGVLDLQHMFHSWWIYTPGNSNVDTKNS